MHRNFFNAVNRVTRSGLGCVWLAGICLLAAFITNSAVYADLVDRIVVVVNNDIILLSELDQAVSSSKSRVVSPEERGAILNQLIDEKLTRQQVDLMGIKISEEEVLATIQRIKEVNNLSDQALLSTIEMEGMTLETFKQKIKDQVLQNRLVNREVKSKVVITDRDVKDYYDAHQELYGGKVQYHLRHIQVNVNADSSESEKIQKNKLIKELHDRLQAGEKFADLAKVYSQSSTASSGGDLGFFEIRLLAPQIRDALKDLKIGQFTDIIDTDQGYQLFLLEEIKTTGGQSLEDVAGAIHDKLYDERMEEKFKLWLTELRSEAHIRIIE